MLFNSLTFLAFFAILLAFYSLPLGWRLRKIALLGASYIFYAAWNPPFVALLWISTAVDWYAAKRIPRAGSRWRKRAFLVLSLSTNLGLLGLFKYGQFVLDSFAGLVRVFVPEYQPAELGFVLPVGISFYTFQTLSYTVDVYRGRIKPWKSPLDFALFVSFFPQLVAGPIVRAADFLPQCRERHKATSEQAAWGFVLLLIGLFQKVFLADGLMAQIVDGVYSAATDVGFRDAWLGTLAFSAQIYFDFAGYSTCAIGVAMVLGFALPDNFRYPYGAVGFSDFWQRWHVSLSSWLRDYLYISLGGNRRGTIRTHMNLMFTMLLGGLWHGASWRFVVWGGLHGLYLWIERWLRVWFGSASWVTGGYVRVALALSTYCLVCLTWVFFRASDFSDAFQLTAAMIGAGDPSSNPAPVVSTRQMLTVLGVTVWLLGSHWYMRNRTLEDIWSRMPKWMRASALAAMLIATVFAPGTDRAFIYFQF